MSPLTATRPKRSAERPPTSKATVPGVIASVNVYVASPSCSVSPSSTEVFEEVYCTKTCSAETFASWATLAARLVPLSSIATASSFDRSPKRPVTERLAISPAVSVAVTFSPMATSESSVKVKPTSPERVTKSVTEAVKSVAANALVAGAIPLTKVWVSPPAVTVSPGSSAMPSVEN